MYQEYRFHDDCWWYRGKPDGEWQRLAAPPNLTGLDPAAAPSPEPRKKRVGRCENHKQAGGCPLHNLHCGYPACDEYPDAHEPQAEPAEALASLAADLAKRQVPMGAEVERVTNERFSELLDRAEPDAGEVERIAARLAQIDELIEEVELEGWHDRPEYVTAKAAHAELGHLLLQQAQRIAELEAQLAGLGAALLPPPEGEGDGRG